MDRSKAILTLLAVNILAVLYIGYTINAAILNNGNKTKAEFQSMQQQVQLLENQILNGISRELAARADKVERLDYTLTGADLAQKNAKVTLQVALKEVTSSAVIAVSLRSDGQDQPLEAVLEHQGGMQYGAELELSLEHNYELTVWERGDAGQKQLNADSRRLPLFDDVYRNRMISPSTGTGISNERLNAEFSFLLKDLGIPGTQLETALLRINRGDKLYDEIDVTQQATPRSDGYAGIEEYYKVARASGQIDNSVTLEQFAHDSDFDPFQMVSIEKAGETLANARYSLYYTINFNKDYPELKLTRDSAGQLSFQWVLRFKDGYEYLN
ncbi:hypothetical protein [Paenibacillus eucommiae]|uniref:Uncharacterized protein n=1 Tax=Paenibacillus eucommiae TaxID=1355755 RepID=A0ABS4J6P5_9BACL|nr:hypothetical protein [Paenibacillus eucommiae]MBP1995475.1 hypothetical protein [Paenibacillus eucommiae]